MENVSKETIPSVFIFNRPGYDDKAAFVLLDPLGAGEARGETGRTEVFAKLGA